MSDPLINLAVSAAVNAALNQLRGDLEEAAPSIQQVDDEVSLAAPDRRVSAGVTFEDARAVPTLFVEREGGWGHQKAEELARSLPVDGNVVIRGSAQSLWPKNAKRVSRRDPVRVGDSVSNYRGQAGTLGCFVTQQRTGRLGFISAAHVLSMLNRARADSRQGDPVIRPGYPDGPKSAAHRIGLIGDFTYLGHYDEDEGDIVSPNCEDVALVVLDSEVSTDECNLVPDPADPSSGKRKRVSGSLTLAESSERYRSQQVFKLGRTTKLTAGEFIGIETESLPITLPDRRVYIYTDLLLIKRNGKDRFSADGDSGALVYTKDFKAMGIIVGGNDEYTWAAPIESCLEAVSAEFVT